MSLTNQSRTSLNKTLNVPRPVAAASVSISLNEDNSYTRHAYLSRLLKTIKQINRKQKTL